MQKIKYGMFVYNYCNGNNVGDDIQSIASKRFLPKVDYYVDRDFIDSVKLSENEKLKIIFNGYFMDGTKNWPPKNKNINPLIISMHVSNIAGLPWKTTSEAFSTDSSVKFFKKFEPIGARDLKTLSFFEDLNIKTYFSGCLTLTLLPDKNIKKQNYILAVNLPDEAYQKILRTTKRPVIKMDVRRTPNLTNEEKFALAEYYLYLYQSAHCVIATRLHSTLPSLALGTKTLYIRNTNQQDPERFEGLYNLVNNMTIEEFINEKKDYNFENPPKNPKDYLVLKKLLEKKCYEYTKHISDKSFMYGKSVEEMLNSPKLTSALVKSFEESYQNFIHTQSTVIDLQDAHKKLITAQNYIDELEEYREKFLIETKTKQDLIVENTKKISEIHQHYKTYYWKIKKPFLKSRNKKK